MAEHVNKLGTWKRYKSEGEAELYTFLGHGEYYKQIEKVEVTVTSEKTDEGYREVYKRGSIVITTTLVGDVFKIDFGTGRVVTLSKSKDVVDDRAVFEMDGFTRIHKREYQGADEYISTNTMVKGDERVTSVDYFRRV